MKRKTIVWLTAAASLVLLGVLLFAGVMTALKWDFSKLSTARYETNTHEISEPFLSLSLTTDTADIVFALSDDGKCRVECYEDENARHSVAVEGETLAVRLIDARSWYDYIGFHFSAPRITIYLPETEYDGLSIHEKTGSIEVPQDFAFKSVDISASTGSVRFSASAREAVKIKTSTGNIRAENVSAGSLDLSATTGWITVSGTTCAGRAVVGVSTGRTDLTDLSCQSLISTGTTGSLSLNHVIAADSLAIERSTGSVKLSGCDAAELSIKTSTGSVTGSLLTDKTFLADSSTGRIDVPQTSSGGQCEITTSTGDIKIEIE